MDNTNNRPKRKTAKRKIPRNDLSNTNVTTSNPSTNNTNIPLKDTKKGRSISHKMNVSNKKPLAVFIIIVVVIIVIGAIIFGTRSLSQTITNHNEQNQLLTSVKELTDTELEQIRATYSSEPTNAPIKENDVVEINYNIYQDGSKVSEGNSTKLILNKESGLPEKIITSLIGKKIKDKVSVEIDSTDGSNTKIKYDMNVIGVYKLAELNDKIVQDFVKDTQKNLSDDQKKQLDNVKTVEDLRKFIEQNVSSYLQQYQDSLEQSGTNQ